MSETKVTFEDILRESTPEIAALAWKIRALILEAAPDAVEVLSIKDRVAAYGPNAKLRSQLVYIALPKDWARLGFYFGSELPDPEHLLEGEGKQMRHIKIRSEQDLDRPAFRALVRAAMHRGNLIMRTNYIGIAAQSLERLAALSDGIFAVAMTLLVLDLHIPASEPIHSEEALWTALVALSPRLLTYFMSFLTLGIFWVAQHTQFSQYQRSDRNFAWIHLAFLLAVSLMPFSTGLLAEYITYRLALVIYWLNLLLLGLMLYISVRYAWRAGLTKPEASPEIRAAQVRRIVLYQALYAVGALLCVINTYVSIIFIVLLQLNSAIAPRIPPLDRF